MISLVTKSCYRIPKKLQDSRTNTFVIAQEITGNVSNHHKINVTVQSIHSMASIDTFPKSSKITWV